MIGLDIYKLIDHFQVSDVVLTVQIEENSYTCIEKMPVMMVHIWKIVKE